MHNPNLSVRTSTKKEAKEVVSVDDLLDHTWHYDCVVSPKFHQKAYTSKPSNAVKAPPLSTEYVSLASFINSSTNTSSNGRDNTLRFDSSNFSAPSPTSSSSFSSSSASSSFYSYAKSQSKSSSRHGHTKCNMASRERDSRKNHADPSRISFYAGFLTVD